MSCEPTSLLRLSRREARFTVSPMTVYSLRRGEPTVPATAWPMWIPMPRRIGQGSPTLLAPTALEHLARRRDRVRGLRGIVDRRAENGEQAVAQELVHDAVVPIDDLDQDLENGVEASDNLGRRARARGRGEAADVDEHHANPPHFAQVGGADRKQPLDHARRDVLTEEIGQFVAGRRGRERALRNGS